MKYVFFLIIGILVQIGQLVSPANAFQSSARAAIAIDFASGAVVMEKNADEPLPPASMSKLMTLFVAFEALRDGRFTLEDQLSVSETAVAYRGSTMFLTTADRVSVEDLIRGIVVLSGNDSSAVIAEALSPDGTEAGFARLMNKRAVELGMTNSHFVNSNGWPHPDHLMSARDLAILSSHIIREFPKEYEYFAEQEFLFDQRVPENRYNRNPLLRLDIGADGLKTGYTRDAGYGLVGSAIRDGQRVIFVLSGMDSANARAKESERLIQWYFLQFKNLILFGPDEDVLRADVWMGSNADVGVRVEEQASVSVPVFAEGEVRVEAIFPGMIEAPVVAGDVVGELVVTVPGLPKLTRFPLVASENVERGGAGTRIKTAVNLLFEKFVLAPLGWS